MAKIVSYIGYMDNTNGVSKMTYEDFIKSAKNGEAVGTVRSLVYGSLTKEEQKSIKIVCTNFVQTPTHQTFNAICQKSGGVESFKFKRLLKNRKENLGTWQLI